MDNEIIKELKIISGGLRALFWLILIMGILTYCAIPSTSDIEYRLDSIEKKFPKSQVKEI